MSQLASGDYNIMFYNLMVHDENIESYRAFYTDGLNTSVIIISRVIVQNNIIWSSRPSNITDIYRPVDFELHREPFARRVTRKVAKAATLCLLPLLGRDVVSVIIRIAAECEKKSGWVMNPAVGKK